jgi:hypothetical protein
VFSVVFRTAIISPNECVDLKSIPVCKGLTTRAALIQRQTGEVAEIIVAHNRTGGYIFPQGLAVISKLWAPDE